MHYGEKAEKDTNSSRFQKTMIELESPDLVVIDGDASSNYGSSWPRYKNFFDDNWITFTKPCEDAGVPYVYALGNHDRIPGTFGGDDPWETHYAVSDTTSCRLTRKMGSH